MADLRTRHIREGVRNHIMKAKRILLLGYDSTQTTLHDRLRTLGHEIFHTDQPIDDILSYDCDLAISFGYRHILCNKILQNCKFPIFNLHISYLPWNRGAHPIFWAFYDNTPLGVTVHLIDEGIDTGPIIDQCLVHIDPRIESFQSAHEFMKVQVENLFFRNLDAILAQTYKLIEQRSKGSFHTSKELPKHFSGWNAIIEDELNRLESIRLSILTDKLNLINSIETIRSRNNVNWMNLLRVIAEIAPERLIEISTDINESDIKISDLFKRLGE